MKVLMLNGSPKAGGNTAAALVEMEKIFVQEGIEVETILDDILYGRYREYVVQEF